MKFENLILRLVITLWTEYKSCLGVFDLIGGADWAEPNWRDYNSCFNTITSSNQIDATGQKDWLINGLDTPHDVKVAPYSAVQESTPS
jgi:hypothetical protein